MSGGIKYTTVRLVALVIALFGSLSFVLLAATGLAQTFGPESVATAEKGNRAESVKARHTEPNSGLVSVEADLDDDGDVDRFDYAVFRPCLASGGPSNEVPVGCATSNLFADEGIQRIDLRDVALFQILFSPSTTIASTSPANGESGVAVTRETIITFDQPLQTPVNEAAFSATFGGATVPALVHTSPDARRVTLFYQDNLPGGSRVRVTFIGDLLLDELGRAVDVDGDGTPGGTRIIDFDTLTLSTSPGTRVCGRVFASELAVGDSGMSVDVPLGGVTITVDGAESELFAVTNSKGDFCLDPAPLGRFFVHIDGRTATNGVPPGAYYPFVGKAWESVAGRETNVGNVFLPLVIDGTLQPVSTTQETMVEFPASVIEAFPELDGVKVMVPPDSLFCDDGTRGGMVGIAPVPPDRLPGQLPEGLEFPLVITVQTDGCTNFDEPAPVCFPNLPDPGLGVPLDPGDESYLYSFNHDKGVWEAIGPMSVTTDGQLICTDPGVGIRAPGWHGSGNPPIGPPPQPPPPTCPAPSASAGLLQVATALGQTDCAVCIFIAGC